MRLVSIVAIAWAAALALPGEATADFGLRLQSRAVVQGGTVTGVGWGSRLPVYLVPAASAPDYLRCRGGYCAPRSFGPPSPPFVYLGRLKATAKLREHQRFAFRLPERVAPGRYGLFLYCRVCGHTLIRGGSTMEGDLIRVRRRRPYEHVVRLRGGEQRLAFTVRRPAGVVLLLRITVPRGSDAYLIGRIGRIAGVGVSTTDGCRPAGPPSIVCTQQVEWCPLPRGTWSFHLHKLRGPPGDALLKFRVGPEPATTR